jgi:hypothetical protein
MHDTLSKEFPDLGLLNPHVAAVDVTAPHGPMRGTFSFLYITYAVNIGSDMATGHQICFAKSRPRGLRRKRDEKRVVYVRALKRLENSNSRLAPKACAVQTFGTRLVNSEIEFRGTPDKELRTSTHHAPWADTE